VGGGGGERAKKLSISVVGRVKERRVANNGNVEIINSQGAQGQGLNIVQEDKMRWDRGRNKGHVGFSTIPA